MFSLIIPAVILWCICFKIDKGTHVPYGVRGGGGDPSPPPPPPAPPSPGETTREVIDAQIESLPKQLAAQQEFGPQFTQQQLDQLEEFGPQFAQQGLDLSQEFGGQFAQQVLTEQDILDPSRSAGSRAINEFIEGGGDQLTPDEIREIEQSARSAASSRGLASSGFSAQDEILRLLSVRQGLKNRFLDVSLSASGRLPAAGGQTVQNQPGAFGPSQLVQGVTPSQFFAGQQAQNQANQSIFNTQAGLFNTQLNAPSIGGTIFGSLAGGVGQGLGTAAGLVGAAKFCWVAAEIFGGWNEPKTNSARFYVMYKSPKWFRGLYMKHGKWVAKLISDKPILKTMLKPLFEFFAKKGGI